MAPTHNTIDMHGKVMFNYMLTFCIPSGGVGDIEFIEF